MSRLKHFSRNLAASYAQMAVNVVYSLVSIPLILHWLPNAEFGLWMVLIQLIGYVSIVDLGMTAAVARLLVDYKDQRADGSYGSLVKTAFLVSLTQGLIILAVVLAGAPWLADLMKIQPEYQATFVALVRIQGAITAFQFAQRPLGLMLEAHQRMDILAYNYILSLLLQLGFLILFLAGGRGIYSFIYAGVITAFSSPLFLSWFCRRLKMLPQAGEWGRASWKKFREVFAFGTDVFLFNLGGQLIMSSQTIIVTRFLGLDVAAVWAVGTKIFTFCFQLLVRPLYMSMPALAEMIVRKEKERLRHRFDGLVVLTGSLGVYMGISYALCNSLFIGIWTHNRIAWAPLNDALLSGWLTLISFQTVHCNLTLVAKQIGGIRYILFLEGCCFVILAGLFGVRWGIPGVIACSIICTAVFSYQYSVRRSLRYFECGPWEALGRWTRPCLNLAVIYGTLAAIIWVVGARFSPLPRLCLNAFTAVAAGGLLFLRVGCPKEMITEILMRFPSSLSKLLSPVLLFSPFGRPN